MYFPPLFSALRASFAAGYSRQALRGDIAAGLTVGIIAIPLAIALAIAVGTAPQHGLYTVLVAGAVIALTGGSRFNVSGPTAAFVVILLPITQKFGVGGLLLCTAMAGVILIIMAFLRAGSLIQFIPYPVVLGFTAGIGVVIATMQIPDALGLSGMLAPENYIERLATIVTALPSIQLGDSLVVFFTLAVLIYWPKFFPKIPSFLVAIIAGALLAALLNAFDISVATLGQRYSYELEGISYPGIPPFLPSFQWPWQIVGAEGQTLQLSFELFNQLLGPALAIAMLGAIESLLCAVISDGMAGTKHDPNGELLGQGIGNIIAPMFGGITATAAIARSAVNVRSGAFSPIAAIIHAAVVLVVIGLFAGWFSYLPMAGLAALLLMVAWNMSEPKLVIHAIRVAPRHDVLVLITCFSLTVLFDMVLAVSVGLLLAAALFIKNMSELTGITSMSREQFPALGELPESVIKYTITGPLFFGAAERALSTLRRMTPGLRIVVINIHAVPVIDMTALVALSNVISDYHKQGISIIFVGAEAKVERKMQKAGLQAQAGKLAYASNFNLAKEYAQQWLIEQEAAIQAK